MNIFLYSFLSITLPYYGSLFKMSITLCFYQNGFMFNIQPNEKKNTNFGSYGNMTYICLFNESKMRIFVFVFNFE